MYQKHPDMVRELNQYRKAKADYFNEVRNLEELTTLLTRVTVPVNGSRVNSSPEPDKIGNRLDKLIEIQDRCIEKQKKAMAEMQKVLELIDLLDNAMYRNILMKRYIHGLKWEQIAVDLGHDFRYIFKLHNYALEDIKRKKT